MAASVGRRSNGRLVRRLFEGKIDIIGDIHGEAGALATLLDRLGYDGCGRHPEGRRLVFVGDLVDRGPNSVAVIDIVKKLVKGGNAQMVLGNHELNLLRGKRKHGNHWFYGEPEVIRKDEKEISFQVLAPSEEWKKDCLDFLSYQPLVLEGDSVTVVHAALDDSCMESLRDWDAKAEESQSQSQSEKSQSEKSQSEKSDILAAYTHFFTRTKTLMEQVEGNPDDIEVKIKKGLIEQNSNPMKVTTSGPEERAEEKFFAGGKWRRVQRKNWWDDYKGKNLVVIGHYWRRFSPPDAKLVEGFNPSGENPFVGVGDFSVAGGGGGVLCVDYSVGIRYEERGKGWAPGAMGTGLAALRLPEMVLVFDSGKLERVNVKN